jgi:hypothetical protein
MDTAAMRQRSLREAARLGYGVSRELPLSDFDVKVREQEETVSRCLALHSIVAISYGLSRELAKAWLHREGLIDAITEDERNYLTGSDREGDDFYHGLVESLWTFVWSLGMAQELDFGKSCPNDLVTAFPDLRGSESSVSFRQRARQRSAEEIVSAADLAYCLHWAIVDAALRGDQEPGRIPSWVVVERRRVLEWLTSSENWDDVSLDT